MGDNTLVQQSSACTLSCCTWWMISPMLGETCAKTRPTTPLPPKKYDFSNWEFLFYSSPCQCWSSTKQSATTDAKKWLTYPWCSNLLIRPVEKKPLYQWQKGIFLLLWSDLSPAYLWSGACFKEAVVCTETWKCTHRKKTDYQCKMSLGYLFFVLPLLLKTELLHVVSQGGNSGDAPKTLFKQITVDYLWC